MSKQRRGTSNKEQKAEFEAAGYCGAGLNSAGLEPEQLGVFSGDEPIGPNSLRDAAREPRFLAGVLDHVTADEALLPAFAAAHEIDPDAVMRARDVLAGGPWERDTP